MQLLLKWSSGQDGRWRQFTFGQDDGRKQLSSAQSRDLMESGPLGMEGCEATVVAHKLGI